MCLMWFFFPPTGHRRWPMWASAFGHFFAGAGASAMVEDMNKWWDVGKLCDMKHLIKHVWYILPNMNILLGSLWCIIQHENMINNDDKLSMAMFLLNARWVLFHWLEPTASREVVQRGKLRFDAKAKQRSHRCWSKLAWNATAGRGRGGPCPSWRMSCRWLVVMSFPN